MFKELRRAAILKWREVATAERRTAWYLLLRGFLFRREPPFVVGRKPDFLTFWRGRMWAEVKSLDPPLSQELIGSAYVELKKRLLIFGGTHRIDARISAAFNQGVAKRAVQLLSNEIRNGAATQGAWYIAVPAKDAERKRVVLEWTSRDRDTVRMVSWRSATGVYACPLEAQPASWISDIQLTDGNAQASIPAYNALSIQISPALMLRIESESEGGGLGSVGTAEAQADTTVERLRRVIDDASDQLKNAQTYRKIPGVAIIYFDHLGGGGQNDILRACLGDLTIPIDVATRKAGEAFYGANGMLRPNKNTAVSALTYRSRFYPTVSFINPWAAYPISPKWVDGVVYSIDGDRLKRH